MSVDKIFEALSSAPRRRILAYLSKTDMTAGEIGGGFCRRDVAAGHLQASLVLDNAGLVCARSAPERSLRSQEDALTGTLVHFLPRCARRCRPFPQGQRRGGEAQELTPPRRRLSIALLLPHNKYRCRLISRRPLRRMHRRLACGESCALFVSERRACA